MFLKRIVIIVILFLAPLKFCYAQQIDRTPAFEELIQKVQEKALRTKTITSEFTQKKHLDFLENDIVSEGRLYYKASDKIKWSYHTPFDYSVVFKSDRLLINDAGKKSKVNIGSHQLFSNLSRLIVKSVNGNMFDDADFNMTYTALKNKYQVDFKTQKADLKKYISQFELVFNQAYEVISVKLIEPTGDYTLIQFKNRNDNTELSDDIFEN